MNLHIREGSQTAIVGRSGSGKSTLLNVLGCLDTPTAGTYEFAGVDVTAMPDHHRTAVRRDHIGFVFQAFHLQPSLDARENVALGLLYRGTDRAESLERADEVLSRVGLDHRKTQSVRTMSGGEQQRVAIARALVGAPSLLLADEPTGNLDSASSDAVIELLADASRATGTTLVVVTHDASAAHRFERVLELEDGRLVSRPTGGAATQARSAPVSRYPPRATASSSEHWEGQARPQRRLRWRSLVREAWISAWSRRRTTLACAFTVAVAVGLVVASLGLSRAARGQVSAMFDAQAGRHVHADINAPSPTDPANGAPSRMLGIDVGAARGLSGVTGVGAYEYWDQVGIRNGPSPAGRATVAVMTGDALSAVAADVNWAPGRSAVERHDEAVVGRGLADRLSIGPIAGAPEVIVDGVHTYVVVGILERSTEPLLQGAVIATGYEAGDPSTGAWVNVSTLGGAARQVSEQIALALDPARPERIDIAPVPDPNSFRASLEGSIAAALIALTAVAVLAAVAILVCVMSLVVSNRTSELGLRRAIGARRVDIALQMTAESTLTGASGGVAGLAAAFVVTHVFFAINGWRPIFDMRIAPLAIVLGSTVGIVAGVVPAHMASRVNPAEALRGVEHA